MDRRGDGRSVQMKGWQLGSIAVSLFVNRETATLSDRHLRPGATGH